MIMDVFLGIGVGIRSPSTDPILLSAGKTI